MIRFIRHLLWKATLVRMYDMRRRRWYVQRVSLAAASASAEKHFAWHYTTERCAWRNTSVMMWGGGEEPSRNSYRPRAGAAGSQWP